MSDGNPWEMENKQVNSMIPPTTDLREFLDVDGGRAITNRAQKIPWGQAESLGRSRWLEFSGQSIGEERAIPRDRTTGLINLLKIIVAL